MGEIDTSSKLLYKSALSKLTSYRRRSFAAELCVTHFGGSSRKTERALGVSRKVIELGLHENRTGILCIELFELRGRKKKKPSSLI